MSEKVKMTCTYREGQAMKSALGILGNRKNASLPAEFKIAKLLGRLKPFMEPHEEVKRKASLEFIEALPEGAELTAMQEQVLAMRIAEKQAEIDAETFEMEVPESWLLKEADLPQEQKGEKGWENATALGAILADLGQLFVMGE